MKFREQQEIPYQTTMESNMGLPKRWRIELGLNKLEMEVFEAVKCSKHWWVVMRPVENDEALYVMKLFSGKARTMLGMALSSWLWIVVKKLHFACSVCSGWPVRLRIDEWFRNAWYYLFEDSCSGREPLSRWENIRDGKVHNLQYIKLSFVSIDKTHGSSAWSTISITNIRTEVTPSTTCQWWDYLISCLKVGNQKRCNDANC